ncbi:MAG: FHA domain-containing protein [Planctomycetaceae bacterium]|nr:FHA domain-containing protein [Planctomycetaceae bacterium]
MLYGPHRGQTFEFSRHESLVGGRAETCQMRLNGDPHVSRFHLRLEVNPPAARIIDLDSSNGIRVNRRAMKWSELRDGD